jgi:hypothetical protein
LDSVLVYLSPYLDYRDCLRLMFLSKSLYDIIHQFYSLRFHNHSSSIHSLRNLPTLFPSLNSLQLSHFPPNDVGIHLSMTYEDLHQFLIQLPILNLSLTGYEISPPSSLFLPLSSPPRLLKKLSLNNVICSPQVLHLCCCHSASLQDLTIISSSSLHDKLLCKLLTMLPALIHLTIQLCYELTHLFYSPPLSVSPLRHLNLSKCSRLQSIHSLTSLITCDVSYTAITSPNLELLIQQNRGLKEFHAMACSQISSLSITSHSLFKLNLQRNSYFKSLILWSSSLSELLLTDCYQLSQLDLYANHLRRLDLKMLVSLDSFHLTSSAISSLDLTGCLLLSKSLQYLFKPPSASPSYNSSSSLCSLSGNVRTGQVRSMTAHDENYERDRYHPHHSHPWGPVIHSTPPSPTARKEFEPRALPIPHSADPKPSRRSPPRLGSRPPSFFLPRHCCLCGHIRSSCQIPPPSLHHSDTVFTELDSNLELVIHCTQLFRPTYRCFHHVNFSLCCPSLELQNIIFPVEQSAQVEGEQQEEEEGQELEESPEQRQREGMGARTGGAGRRKNSSGRRRGPQRKRSQGVDEDEEDTEEEDCGEEESLFLKMERRLTM